MFNNVGVRVAAAAIAVNPSLRAVTSLGSALTAAAAAGVVSLPILKVFGVGFALTLPFHWKVTLPLMVIGVLVSVAAFKIFFMVNRSSAHFNDMIKILLDKGYTQDEIVFAIQMDPLMQFGLKQYIEECESSGAKLMAENLEELIKDPMLAFDPIP